jgi:MFS family permease
MNTASGLTAEGGARMAASAQPAPLPRPAVAWTAVFVLLLLFGLSLLDRQIVSLMVKPMRAELQISDFQVGLLQGFAFALLHGIVGLPIGYAVDRVSRRLVVFLGVAIWATAATCCGLAQNYPQLLLARSFVGIGEAALAPAAFSILSNLFPRDRLTFALSVFSIGALIGASGAFAIGGFVIHSLGDGISLPVLGHLSAWRIAFIVTGLPGLVLCFAIFLIPEPPRGADAIQHATWRALVQFVASQWRFFVAHLTGFGFVITAAYGFLAWAPSFLIRSHGMSPAQAGLSLAGLILASGVVGFVVSGRLVDILMRRGISDAHFRYYFVASLVLALSGALAFQVKSDSAFFALLFVAQIPMGISAIAASAIQLVTPSNLRGRVSAMYLVIAGTCGMVLGPALVAGFTDFLFGNDARVGDSVSLTFLIAATAAAIAFLLGLGPMRQAVAAAVARER